MITTVMLLSLRYKKLWQQVAIVLLMADYNGQYSYSHLRGLTMQNSSTFKADMSTGKLVMTRRVGDLQYNMVLKSDPRKTPAELQVAVANIEAELVRSVGIDAVIKEVEEYRDNVVEELAESVDSAATRMIAELQQELIKERNKGIFSFIWRRICRKWNR